MNSTIKQLAERYGIWFDRCNDLVGEACDLERLVEFVEAAAVAREREACAKLCESMGVHPALNVWGGGPEWYKRQKECAAAIRGRAE